MEASQESHRSTDVQNDTPHISWPMNRPKSNGPWTPKLDQEMREKNNAPQGLSQNVLFTELLPGQAKALDGISIRAFFLGVSLAANLLISIFLASNGHQVWRAPFFLSALSLFHFLEFYVTAAYNTRYANISAYLLSQNGYAYNMAHSLATLECIATAWFFPTWQAKFGNDKVKAIGLVMVLVGQVTRSLAMAEAGTNFNHTVQIKKNVGHELVTSGIYAYLRHPSYFGFFWWAIGTQLVLGNAICFCAYTGLLWMFFSSRIRKEEELLISFFGNDYIKYRQKTAVGIPLIP